MMCQTAEAAGVIDMLSAQAQSHSANSPGRRSAAEASCTRIVCRSERAEPNDLVMPAAREATEEEERTSLWLRKSVSTS